MKNLLLGLTLLTSTTVLANECYIGLNPATSVAISKDENSKTRGADNVKVILEKRDHETAIHLKVKPKNSIRSLKTMAFNFPGDEAGRYGIECDGGAIMVSQSVVKGETVLVLNSDRARFSGSGSEGCDGYNVAFKNLNLKKVQCAK